MPSAEFILSSLERIANEGIVAALAWHVVVGAALLAVFVFELSPSPRLATLAASLPLASVSAFAFAFGNPFNGAVFAILSATLAVLGWRRPTDLARPPLWARGLGGMMLAFAWVYPHFLVGRSPLAYLWGAPMGLIPCPTLSLVLGLALLGLVPARRAWSLTVAGAGLFYAVFGVLRLGVTLDVPLFLGALALVATTLSARSTAGHREPVVQP